jgi:hypothetical protein
MTFPTVVQNFTNHVLQNQPLFSQNGQNPHPNHYQETAPRYVCGGMWGVCGVLSLKQQRYSQ